MLSLKGWGTLSICGPLTSIALPTLPNVWALGWGHRIFSVEEWDLVTSSCVLVCVAGCLRIFQTSTVLEVSTCFQRIKQLLLTTNF